MFGKLGLGIDGALAGAPDVFGVMKVLHNVEVGAAEDELAILPRQVLEFATIGGARSIGMADKIGSVAVGKRADLQLVASQSVTMGPLNDDPSALLVYSAAPRDVVTVMVAGRILKREGRLTGLPEQHLVAEARRSIETVRSLASSE